MLFNSLPFLGLFLPATLIGFYALGRRAGPVWLMAFLASASLVFYGAWNPPYLALLTGSIVVNYALSRRLMARPSGFWLAVGIAANLILIGVFKYAGFLAGSIAALGGLGIPIPEIVLPLAISFFTFQQIAYLVEANRGEVGETGLVRYALFVSFFPQLIAGPIVRFGEVAQQFAGEAFGRFNGVLFAGGVALFVIGLAKKILLADPLALYASPIFAAAELGLGVTTAEAWVAALAYTFQLYFDFSGYSDMAVGLGLMFGVKLPFNFNAPYRAASMIEFWRCWHMTLSRFLRDYLYFPLGGNRKGTTRRYGNLMLVMLLGGLWHGAGWTFVIWGGLHGLYLLINHAWHSLAPFALPRWAGVVVTFLAVVAAWVVFRAESFDAAALLYEAMAGFGSGDGSLVAPGELLGLIVLFSCSAVVIWTMPTSIALHERIARALGSQGRSVVLNALGALFGLAFACCLAAVFLGVESEFIYFQF